MGNWSPPGVSAYAVHMRLGILSLRAASLFRSHGAAASFRRIFSFISHMAMRPRTFESGGAALLCKKREKIGGCRRGLQKDCCLICISQICYLKYFSQVDLKIFTRLPSQFRSLPVGMPRYPAYCGTVMPRASRLALICLPWS